MNIFSLVRWRRLQPDLRFRELAISIEHGQRAGLLPGDHKDPFDRTLIAQAQAQNLPIVSNERVFDVYRVRRIWQVNLIRHNKDR